MKSFILNCAVIFFSVSIWAQEVTTNHPDSNYKFEKISSLDAAPVLSQGQSGTCWSFSALSFFESEIMRLKKEQIILSEMFIVRSAYYEKAVKYIRMDGKINFGEGGAFHDIPYIIKRYGIVPSTEYTGLREGEENINHSELFGIMEAFVHGVQKAAEKLSRGATLSPTWKVALSSILDAYLGKVPESFNYKGKSFTPMSFAEHLKLNMDEYVSITSFTHFPLYEQCMLEIPDN